MFCISCGKQVSDSAVFCPNCGLRVGGGKAKEEPPKVSLGKKDKPNIPAALREDEGAGSTVYLASGSSDKKMFSSPKNDLSGAGETAYIPDGFGGPDPDSSQTVYMPSDDVFASEKTVYMPGESSEPEVPSVPEEEEIYTAPTEMLGENVIDAKAINAPVKPPVKKEQPQPEKKKVPLNKKADKVKKAPEKPMGTPAPQPVQPVPVSEPIPIPEPVPEIKNVAPPPEGPSVPVPPEDPALRSPVKIAKDMTDRSSNPTPTRRKKKNAPQAAPPPQGINAPNPFSQQPQPQFQQPVIQPVQPVQPQMQQPFQPQPPVQPQFQQPQPAPERHFDDNDETQIIPPIDSYEREVIQSLPPQQQYEMMDDQIPPYPQPQQPLPEYVGNGPVPAQPQAAPAPAKKKLGAGRLFGAFMVSLFAFLFLLILGVLVCVKFGASGDTLYNRIRELDSETLLSSDYNGKELSSSMFDTLGFESLTHGAADKNNFRSFMNELDFTGFIADKAASYADYIIDGKGNDPSVKNAEVIDFFGSNNQAAEANFGMKLSKEDLSKLNVRLDNNDFENNLSIKEWSDKAGFELKNGNYIFSYITFGIIFALIIVLLIWTAVILDKKGRYIAGFYGNVFFWSGLIMLAGGLALLAGAAIAYSMTSDMIFYVCSNVMLPFSCIAMGIGAVELLLGIIFKRVKKNKKRKEKANRTPAPQQ